MLYKCSAEQGKQFSCHPIQKWFSKNTKTMMLKLMSLYPINKCWQKHTSVSRSTLMLLTKGDVGGSVRSLRSSAQSQISRLVFDYKHKTGCGWVRQWWGRDPAEIKELSQALSLILNTQGHQDTEIVTSWYFAECTKEPRLTEAHWRERLESLMLPHEHQ